MITVGHLVKETVIYSIAIWSDVQIAKFETKRSQLTEVAYDKFVSNKLMMLIWALKIH